MTDHLTALQVRLSHEHNRLARATKPAEIELRTVWVAQIEKEIAGELARIGELVHGEPLRAGDLIAGEAYEIDRATGRVKPARS
jgi:hypothetical protein